MKKSRYTPEQAGTSDMPRTRGVQMQASTRGETVNEQTEFYIKRMEHERRLTEGAMGLGRALAAQRRHGGSVNPKSRRAWPLIKAVVASIRKEYPEYSQWRIDQGQPLSGDYQELYPTTNHPMARLALTAKEMGFMLSIGNREKTAAALNNLVKDAEAAYLWAHERNKNKIQRQPETASTT